MAFENLEYMSVWLGSLLILLIVVKRGLNKHCVFSCCSWATGCLKGWFETDVGRRNRKKFIIGVCHGSSGLSICSLSGNTIFCKNQSLNSLWSLVFIRLE